MEHSQQVIIYSTKPDILTYLPSLHQIILPSQNSHSRYLNFAQVDKQIDRWLKEYVHFSTYNCVIPILQIIKLTRRSLVVCLRL